jgi:hypothetical protein
VPGQRYTVTLQLNAIAHHLPVGHRWRLALAPDYWPIAWPSPQPATLTVYTGPHTCLTLPVRPPRTSDLDLPAFGPPEHAAPLSAEEMLPGTRTRTFSYDDSQLRLISVSDDGRLRLTGSGIEMYSRLIDTYEISQGQPLTASIQCNWELELARDDWRVRIVTKSRMTADASNFMLTNTLHAYEGSELISSNTWNKSFTRDGN